MDTRSKMLLPSWEQPRNGRMEKLCVEVSRKSSPGIPSCLQWAPQQPKGNLGTKPGAVCPSIHPSGCTEGKGAAQGGIQQVLQRIPGSGDGVGRAPSPSGQGSEQLSSAQLGSPRQKQRAAGLGGKREPEAASRAQPGALKSAHSHSWGEHRSLPHHPPHRHSPFLDVGPGWSFREPSQGYPVP